MLKRKNSIPVAELPRIIPSSSRTQSKGKGKDQSQEGVKGCRTNKNVKRRLDFSGIVIQE